MGGHLARLDLPAGGSLRVRPSPPRLPEPMHNRSGRLKAKSSWLELDRALIAEGAAAFFIGLVALVAQLTGTAYILFPELGALSQDILKRPHGTWARAPVMLVLTPMLTGLLGTIVAQHLNYGFSSVLLTVGGSLLIMRLLKSPVAPAISAGLLPLTLGLRTWWYPASLIVGLGALALVSVLRRRIAPPAPQVRSIEDVVEDTVEAAPSDYSWAPYFLVFLLTALVLVRLTGWYLLLYPPLVVIGFEMFAHASVCPWAARPFALPIAVTLSAALGVLFVAVFGAGPLAAVCSMIAAMALLRIFRLHVPPALAVGLLPLIVPHPTYVFPLAAGLGTLLLIAFFVAWRSPRIRFGAAA